MSEHLSRENDVLQEIHQIITITRVHITPDSSYMDVYVSALKNPETLTKHLAEHAAVFQKNIWKHIGFMKVPKIRFRYDASGKDMSDTIHILDEISEETL